jgi:hypothetical protein
MIMPILRSALAGLACAGVLALASPSMAAMMTFKADLKAASEVPPNNAEGSGEVTVTYDPTTKLMSWKGSYSGLTGPATAAHFHGPAPAGKNAGVMIPIHPDSSPLSGSANLTEAQAKALIDGDMYINVHTAAHKGGEIRGQLMK